MDKGGIVYVDYAVGWGGRGGYLETCMAPPPAMSCRALQRLSGARAMDGSG